MDWISGIGRNDKGDLCVKVQVHSLGPRPGATPEVDGSPNTTVLRDFGALRADLDKSGASGTLRRKVYLPLHELRVGGTTTRDYLDGLGLNALESDGQPVYEVSTSAGLMVIPAQVLVQAILAPHLQFRRALLRPWGPRFLMSAFVASGAQSLAVLPTPHRMLQIQLEQPTISTKLEWVLAYPSATSAWCSVYRHALDGSFDMDMPMAFATSSVIARQVDGKLLVTRLEVMQMTPAEEPHPFAAEAAKNSFVFNASMSRRPTHGKAAAPTKDERFTSTQQRQRGTEPSTGAGAAVAPIVPMTDEQWTRIKPLVLGAMHPKGLRRVGAPRTHAMRDVVDVIRLKLGTPYSWLKVPADKNLVSTASAMLTKLKRAGVWECVAAANSTV